MNQRLSQYAFFGMIFVQAVFRGYVMTESASICTEDIWSACDFASIMKRLNISTIVSAEEFLNENCGTILDYARCFANYRSTCPLSSEKLNSAYGFRSDDELISLVQNLCNETSPLRQGYIQHMDCLSKHPQEFQLILNETSRKFTDFWKEYSKDKTIKYTLMVQKAMVCVMNSQMKKDIERFFVKTCGQQAFEFWFMVYDHIIKPNEAECSADETAQHLIRSFEEFYSSGKSSSYTPKNVWLHLTICVWYFYFVVSNKFV